MYPNMPDSRATARCHVLSGNIGEGAMKSFTSCLSKRFFARAVLVVGWPSPAAAGALPLRDAVSGSIFRCDITTGALVGIFAASSQLSTPIGLP